MKKFCYKFLIITLAVGMLIPTWLTLDSQKAQAAAIGSGGAVTGPTTVNGVSSFSLNPFTITSNIVNDIDSSGIFLSILDASTASLQFDIASNIVATPIGAVVVSTPTTPNATGATTITVTNPSSAGDMVVLSGMKIKTTAAGVGTARLQAIVNGGTVYGDIINIDAQLPTITGVETQDLSANGQLDAVKVTFSENIDDLTVQAANFQLADYGPLNFFSTTNGDLINDNIIYLTFAEIVTPDTFATPNLTYNSIGGILADLAGNLLTTVTITSINNTIPSAPANLVATVGDGEVSLTWDAVVGADYYNVYYQKFSDSAYSGPIATTQTSTKIIGPENGVMYRFIVRAVRVVGAEAVESSNAWLEATPVAPKIVLAVAKVKVVESEATQVQPQVEESIAEEPVEEGRILGEEEQAKEEEDINWTPWIILFILIILAGAATGGYFYWFGREEEEIISKEVVEKSKKSVAKKDNTKSKKSTPSKKNKRW